MSEAPPIDVLLVEDDPDDAEFTLRAIRKINVGLRIVRVEDGVSALEYLFCSGAHADRVPPTLPRMVLLDLKLPKVDGLEVLRRIKSDPRTRGLPSVVLSSSREPRDIQEAYLRGANSYVVKPIGYAEMIATLGEIVRYWFELNETPRA